MVDPLDALMDEEARSRVREPIESARTLPREAFTSEAFEALEVERIFKRRWIAARFESEIAAPGDAVPFDLCGMPLLAVRGGDGRPRVFHNVCPYDGCPVVLAPAKGLSELVVPYHGWTYDLNGKLVGTPFWNGKPDCEIADLGGRSGDLAEVSSEAWLGAVWVNLAAEPESFASYIAPAERVLSEYRLDDLAIGCTTEGEPVVERRELHANWKTFLENACVNVLHESFVHRIYNESAQVPRVDANGAPTWFHDLDGTLLTFGYRRADFVETYKHPALPHIGASEEPEHEHFLTLYPNLVVSTGAEHMLVAMVLPLAPGCCEVSTAYFFEPSAAADPMVGTMRELYGQAVREDTRVLEAVQKARRSPAFSSQFYSPAWDTLHHQMNQLILDDLEKP